MRRWPHAPTSRCSRCDAAQGDDSWRARLSRSDASARPVDAIEGSVLEPSHVLVEIEAASPSRAFVLQGTSALLDQIRMPTTLVWLVAGVGRVLPARLFDAMSGRLQPPEDHGLELIDVQVADRIAGPTGLERPEHLIRRVDAPVAPSSCAWTDREIRWATPCSTSSTATSRPSPTTGPRRSTRSTARCGATSTTRSPASATTRTRGSAIVTGAGRAFCAGGDMRDGAGVGRRVRRHVLGEADGQLVRERLGDLQAGHRGGERLLPRATGSRW